MTVYALSVGSDGLPARGLYVVGDAGHPYQRKEPYAPSAPTDVDSGQTPYPITLGR